MCPAHQLKLKGHWREKVMSDKNVIYNLYKNLQYSVSNVQCYKDTIHSSVI